MHLMLGDARKSGEKKCIKAGADLMAIPAQVALTPFQSISLGSTHLTNFLVLIPSKLMLIYVLVSFLSASSLPLDRKTHERETLSSLSPAFGPYQPWKHSILRMNEWVSALGATGGQCLTAMNRFPSPANISDLGSSQDS